MVHSSVRPLHAGYFGQYSSTVGGPDEKGINVFLIITVRPLLRGMFLHGGNGGGPRGKIR